MYRGYKIVRVSGGNYHVMGMEGGTAATLATAKRWVDDELRARNLRAMRAGHDDRWPGQTPGAQRRPWMFS